jgi:hypothetical protein
VYAKAVVQHRADVLKRLAPEPLAIAKYLVATTECDLLDIGSAELFHLGPELLFSEVHMCNVDCRSLTVLHLATLTQLLKAQQYDCHLGVTQFGPTVTLVWLSRDLPQFLVASFMQRRLLRHEHLGLEPAPLNDIARTLT